MQCHRPYGQYISSDGIHPTEDGQTLLANAAVEAINARYALGLVPRDVKNLPRTATCEAA
jgi:phospholipase/lecithinase/hemolysin